MASFLEEVASHLYTKHGDNISKLKIIFPSRRARLFFVDALSRITKRPVWQPRWVSMDDMMSKAAGCEVGDRVRLIAELYKIYSTHHNESFDKFYFWGEILLADFDMIDKYLIDADMLFRNVSDIKELEADISYLTPEQLKIVSFWSSLGEEADLSEEKRRFLKIWRSLAPIYHAFHNRLEELGIAYTGMIHRHAVVRLQSEEYSFEGSGEYAVVGFNALSECEKLLLTELKNSSSVEMFWDYDDYYKLQDEQEAGLFIRENVARFPAPDTITHNNMESIPKEIEVVGAASNILQCKYVSNIIEQIQRSGQKIDKNTAIVLTNENLLLPLLYSLPEDVGKVNVTMGYPLRESLAYSFIERLIELQHHSKTTKGNTQQFYHIDVVGILSHPYISSLDTKLIDQLKKEISKRRMIMVDREFLACNEILRTIFSCYNNWFDMSKYLTDTISAVESLPYSGDDQNQRDEFLNYISSHITTLHNSIMDCEIEMSTSIYISLLRRHIQTLRIPFEGEPLEGIQVMGILETRNLDFRNVIILSMSDDNFPGNHISQPSFVPYNLRSAYGLPTPEHHEGVYAYYFYRLLQRSENVWLVYSSHADDKSSGEASRYIYQLDYESPFCLKRSSVGVDVNMIESENIEIAKVGRVAEQLSRFTDELNPTILSPTALYRYIACPLRFYFYSLARIREEDELSEEVDAPMFGTILHAAMQELYKPLRGEVDFATPLRKAMEGDRVEKIVEMAINDNYLQKRGARSEDYSGNILLIKEIVCKYIRDGIVTYDLSKKNFIIKDLECEATYDLLLDSGKRMRFNGILDRMDCMEDGSLRVVDYKSGSAHLDFKGIESLFEGTGKERMSNIIQTLLYSMMLSYKNKGVRITPALYYVRSINTPNYSPYIVDCSNKERKEILSYSDVSDSFEKHIKLTLNELFDLDIPFRQCKDVENTCKYCDYRTICKRIDVK
ncbi:MAG: PD-(D/E)XK nuclease family protein [Rikenellaceae bacterium]